MADPQTLKLVGYWAPPSGEPSPYPHPKGLVCPGWRAEDRERIVAYLRSGHVLAYYLGHSLCRLCGARNGAGEFTDGEWVWPEGLAHYLEAHSVRLPEELVAAMQARGWQVPPPSGETHPGMVDESFWLSWGARAEAGTGLPRD